jgi:hypothetical protein
MSMAKQSGNAVLWLHISLSLFISVLFYFFPFYLSILCISSFVLFFSLGYLSRKYTYLLLQGTFQKFCNREKNSFYQQMHRLLNI